MPSPHRILVVDDEEKIRRSLSGLLQDQSYEVITVGSGSECLQIMSAEYFDLVIVDVVMPELNGIEVLQEIKEKYSDTEVIMITGYADKEKAIAALRLSAYDFIEKPFESREILNTIAHCLNELGLRKEIERKNQKIRESEEFTKNILESVDEGFIVIDREYRIISANKAYCDQVRMPIEHIIGKYCHEISHHVDMPCHKLGEECSVRHALETEKSFSSVHTHYDFERNPIHIQIKSFPMRDTLGRINSVIGIINDITEKKKLESQLHHAQKMEAIGTLTGGIAHEFNNLLTSIIGYGKLLQEGIPKEDNLQHYTNQLLASSGRAAKLVKSLLAFSREHVLDRRPVKLSEIINGVERLLVRILGEDIELVTDLKDGGAIIMADYGQMEQVLVNLATNARDAMPDGGRLTMTTDVIELDEKCFKTHNRIKPGRYALISVTDTGSGIDERTREKIFEPFFTTREVGKGTGLGLSIAYAIIGHHNGYVNVSSEIGKGTTFEIYLPILESYVQELIPADIIVPAGGTETILLAEDNKEVRELTKNLLQKFGYEVLEAVDGEDAIKRFKEDKDKICLLVFDLIMPKKNGKEAYEEIKNMRSDIKVLFTSGYTGDIIRKKGLHDAEFNFIPKPIAPKEFLRKVREVLDR